MCDSEVCSVQFGISKCAMCDFEVCSVQFLIWKLEVNTALTGHRTAHM